DAAAADDHIDLFLAGAPLVVLDALPVRRELEPVHPERLDTELAAQKLHAAAGPGALHLVDLQHRVAHVGTLTPLTCERRRTSTRGSGRSTRPRCRARARGVCRAGR